MQREPNTQYVLSLSYGKDSLACLEAIRVLGLPLDRIVHAEVWATDTIPADLPPMVEFKQKADAIILERYGIVVEHICATERERERRLSFESQFYKVRFNKSRRCDQIYGFPITRGAWCNSKLKMRAVQSIETNIREPILSDTRGQNRCLCGEHNRFPDGQDAVLQQQIENSCIELFFNSPGEQGAKINTVQYLGIAADEPERIARHTKPNTILPLVEAGWDEAFCRQLCKELRLLSPIYTTAARGGCWFCHNQGIDQLRLLRKNYPDLWQLLLKWDKDSPVTFHPDGHTVHHFDIRFQAEDEGLVPSDRKFRWKMLGLQISKQSKGETNGERQD